ncbi:MAG: hypothetical protein ABFS34_01705 [Gemmatimonadota bacterium]
MVVRNFFGSTELADGTRRRLDLAIAVAQERLLGTHVSYALDLVELVRGRVDFASALDIYIRVLGLDDDDARVVSTQVMARIGEREDEGEPSVAEPVGSPAEGDGRPHRSFIAAIRDRLRGRENDELRTVVDLHRARTEVALLETHVDNAMNFVEVVRAEVRVDEAAEMYIESLGVREAIAPVVYYITLDRLSDELLPRGDAQGGVQASTSEQG